MRTLILTVVLTAGTLAAAEHTQDTPAQVQQAVAKKKAVLIDVREPTEWAAGHLQAAALLPLSRLKKGVPADELGKTLPKGKIVYLHCKSGGRSLIAADLLTKQGYDARPLEPGYEDLLKAGFEKAK